MKDEDNRGKQAIHLNKSSNALRASGGRLDPVSRSTVTRTANNVHVLRLSLGEILAGIGCVHSNRLPESNELH